MRNRLSAQVHRVPRPRGATLPAMGAAVAVALWATVAHDALTGWVQALGALALGIVSVGLLAPAIAVWRARCHVVSSPTDATAGGIAVLDVVVNAPLELRPLYPPGPPVLSGARSRIAVELHPGRRGIVDAAVVTVASAAPFGLLWWTRTLVLPLPRPLAVAPRVGSPDAALLDAIGHGASSPLAGALGGPDSGAASASGHVAGGEYRGVRAYQRGDRQHLVHWPATAHAGTLMVRETARPAGRTVCVDGVLPDDPALAEVAAERAMGSVAALLRSGAGVELVTAGPEGPVTVTTTAAAGRRLAFALPQARAGTSGNGTAGARAPDAAAPDAAVPGTFARLFRRHAAIPPEHSVVLRAAAAGAVSTGIIACAAVGELPASYALAGVLLVLAGNVFSYVRRRRQLPYVKAFLAAAMVGAFAWFFATVSGEEPGSVLAPLAILFTALLIAHAFDVPSRRDLVFSLAGSITLVGVASAQAVDLGFALYAAAWAVFVVAGLDAAWRSKAGGARVRHGAVALACLAALCVTALALVLLPAPAQPGGGQDGLNAAGASAAAEPSHLVPASSSGRPAPASAAELGVGGYLGFAGPLDTAARASMGDEVVLRVRADRPTYWIAETFDHWSGDSWSETGATAETLTGQPFVVPPASSASPASSTRSSPAAPGTRGKPDYQTFYLAASGTDLVLHASQAEEIWYPARALTVTSDGTIESRATLGPGSVYTVLSTVSSPTVTELEAANGASGLSAATLATSLQLPHAYPRVRALAERITAGQATVYGKVVALERWIGEHTRYTTDIPPLAPGQDTVSTFLFHTRRGYCEQISTALAVMLRTLGIPAREATGYVPGPYDPVTDLYDVEAKDAHAWVQVWFPGYGWQSFDPTAYVAPANPSPGATIGHDIAAVARRIPLLPTLPLALLGACVVLTVAWLRRRPRTWQSAVTRELERAARRAGAPAKPDETLVAVASRLDALSSVGAARASPAAAAAESAAWGSRHQAHSRAAGRDHVRAARRVRRGQLSAPAGRRLRRSSLRTREAVGTPSRGEGG